MRTYPLLLVGKGTFGAASSRRNAIEGCENYAKAIGPEDKWKWTELSKHEGVYASEAGHRIEFRMHQINEGIGLDD